MRYKMQLNKKILKAALPLLMVVATSSYASDTQTSGNFENGVNPGLYPPMSSGEASPWQDESELPAPDISGTGNPWGAAPVAPEPRAYGVPVAPANPYYGYGARQQPQTPYYYPPQQPYGYAPPAYGYAPPAYGYAPPAYGYAPPAYGYAPSYPQMPYGGNNNYGPFNTMPFSNMPMNPNPFNGVPFNNNGGNNSPFGFSMPWGF